MEQRKNKIIINKLRVCSKTQLIYYENKYCKIFLLANVWFSTILGKKISIYNFFLSPWKMMGNSLSTKLLVWKMTQLNTWHERGRFKSLCEKFWKFCFVFSRKIVRSKEAKKFQWKFHRELLLTREREIVILSKICLSKTLLLS